MQTRRSVIKAMAASCAVTGLNFTSAADSPSNRQIIKRTLPNSDEALPVIGFGTSRVFDVSRAPEDLAPLREVVSALLSAGGTVIDSAHNYHRAEGVVGYLLGKIEGGDQAFLSTKIYATGKDEGLRQIGRSFNRLKRNEIDLMHVHNMIDVDTQLPILRALKDEGRIKHIGLSHYSDDGIDALADFITHNSVDFIQFRYSLENRYAEDRLFALAQEKGVAVMINQPFSKGQLFKKIQGIALPVWAPQIGCETWAQYFLKFIVSHPAVHCVIPGTGKLTHAIDNIGAGMGYMPNAEERKDMLSYWKTL